MLPTIVPVDVVLNLGSVWIKSTSPEVASCGTRGPTHDCAEPTLYCTPVNCPAVLKPGEALGFGSALVVFDAGFGDCFDEHLDDSVWRDSFGVGVEVGVDAVSQDGFCHVSHVVA